VGTGRVAAPRPVIALQGAWVSEVTDRLVGRVEGGFIVWHPSYHSKPTKLHAADGGAIEMELGGARHKAAVENDGPRTRLRWSDGDLWFRVSVARSSEAASSSTARLACPAVPKGTVGVAISRKRARESDETLLSRELFARAEALSEREEGEPAIPDVDPGAENSSATSPTSTEEVSSEEFRRNSLRLPSVSREDVRELREALAGLVEEARQTLEDEIPGTADGLLAMARAKSDELSRLGVAIIPGTDREAFEEERLRSQTAVRQGRIDEQSLRQFFRRRKANL